MKVAINTFPLNTAHQARGIGAYTRNLLEQLKKRTDVEVLEFDKTSEIKEVDVMHFPWFDLFFHTLPIRKKFPTVVTVHDVIPLLFQQAYPIGIKGKLNFFLQRLALKSCKAIITDSKISKSDIVKTLKISGEKVQVIPLAADENFKLLSDSEKLRVQKKYKLPKKFLLYVGDANFVKNLPFLIDCFKKLGSSFGEMRLVLVGGVFLKKIDNIIHPELDSLRQVFYKIDKFKLREKILMPGQVPADDLVGFYNLATVYVQPSLYEGFGLPILEAMRCGCPVISSNTGSLKEVGGDAALYFNPQNPEQFFELLSRLLEDASLRNKLSKLGILQAEIFSWEKTTDETVEVYKNICEK